MSSEDKPNVIYLDLYRRNWSVGYVYCAECERAGYQMWVTGAEIIDCPNCAARIPLTLERE
jgi:hypothetical protein